MMDLTTFYDRVAALGREGRPFAVATVVGRRRPVSAHLGDRAIVFADGRMEGFVGGACSREIIRTQALDVLRTRAPRLVSIDPDAAGPRQPAPDHVVVPMTCASEGAVDVYVEPVVRPRSVVVAGATPVADAVARLARAMRFDVVRVVTDEERADAEADASAIGATLATLDALESVLADAAAHGGDCALVVASQGHYDEPALEAGLKSGVRYVGLVASRKRGEGIRTWLAGSRIHGADRLRNPAGLDLGGTTAEEVALSILAEVVQLGAARHALTATGGQETSPAGIGDVTPTTRTSVSMAAPAAGLAVDPVCRMEVAVEGAKHTADVDGVTYYFCCPGCRARFVRNPQQYLAPVP